MSKDYSIKIIIDVDYDVNNISKILARGSENLKFAYYKPDLMQYDPALLEQINPLQGLRKLSDFKDRQIFLVVNYERTFFFLHCDKEINGISIIINHFSYPWYRVFENNKLEDIDIAQYLRIIINWIEPYRIISLLVEKR